MRYGKSEKFLPPRPTPWYGSRPMWTAVRVRRHLELDADQPELLDGAGAADPALAEEGGWLLGELMPGVIERVLEDARDPWLHSAVTKR